MPTQPDCDLFCRVIDNYGDIGVCWRLAQQLRAEHGWRVRIWVDDIRACDQLTQGRIPVGITLQPWLAAFPAVTPAQIVVEAFACELPENYLAAMAAMPRQPVWFNLEYLCVEDWGPGFHLQPSPHPRLPLLKHFFVPGILPGTGGVLRESGLAQGQAAFDIEAARRTYADDTSGRWLFLFCYDNPALPLLLDAWQGSDQPLHCLVSAGKANAQAAAWLGRPLQEQQSVQRGNLHLHALPFVAQHEFDRLLWTCDLNFVRGEDSLCRALWSGLPFVWQIYPQPEDAHHVKLAAFQHRYDAPAALNTFSDMWNGITSPEPATLARAWQALEGELPALTAHSRGWTTQLESLGNLAANLAYFCKESAK
jgi:uncharacterized repeat protein (TIGR03837 family)